MTDERRTAIIPQPVVIEEREGVFHITPVTVILAPAAAADEARYLAESLRAATGFAIPVRGTVPGAAGIVLELSEEGAAPPEGYTLDVTTGTVRLAARTLRGLFAGIQTLRQLLPADSFRAAPCPGPWTLPAVHIEDYPRFEWRGMLLDCARHFMPKEFIRKFIDLLALHKFNVFHWHLTDDQGWRLEIRKYPRLTGVGAWRDETVIGHNSNRPRRFDNTRYGGFYTQADVREIVAYAARRHITVVPEIEMPGHSQAALTAYPELGCSGGPYHVRKIWGISNEVYCAGNDRTFAFIEDVLGEVLELFPGRFIHVGGDECLKERWQQCPRCQARIKAEGLTDEHGLQSYFIRRIEAFLNRHDRRLIGWDEILEGGLAPDATVMSWRSTEGGIQAAQAGHDTVFATHTHTYFDYCQGPDPFAEPLAIGGYLPLEQVYTYEPVPDAVSAEQRRHVLGAQGQLWTEYLADAKTVEFMAFPRLTALCEVLWTPPERKDYSDYRRRLAPHLERLAALDVNYRRE